ncbi:MAG: hypothetical protein RL169_1560 [Armatimonadota bacterium]|jgi:DNA-binding SARP family transcriptional activator
MQKPSINIYGPFQALDCDGNRVELASTKARHIFTALIMAYPEPVQRELLCRMIWPDSSDESRKVRLRQEVGILREFTARLERDEMLVVDKGFLALNIDAVSIDCLESRQLYSAFSSTLPLDDRLNNLTEQIRILGRGQIAPDAQNLFDTERKRKCARLTTARIELTKLYIDAGRLPEARKVLDAVLDEHPENEIAKALSARLLETPLQFAQQDDTKQVTPSPEIVKVSSGNWLKRANWKVRLGLAAVVLAVIVAYVFPTKVNLISPTPTTATKTPPITQIIAYQHTPAPDELNESEFLDVARTYDGMAAVAGIVKTKTEDVDGLVTLLGPDMKAKWTRRFTSSSHDCDRLESVRFDTVKNVYAGGETYLIKQPDRKDGWYGSVVSYDADGKLRFKAFTKRQIIHGSEVKRRIVADERGGVWYCTSTAESGKERIFATHFDSNGRITNDIVISGVQAKVLAFNRHTQDEYVISANAVTNKPKTGVTGLVASFNNDGRILWTSTVEPATGTFTTTSEILAVQDEYHFIGGLTNTLDTGTNQIKLEPSIAFVNVHTGATWRVSSIKPDIPNPYVSLFGNSRSGEVQMVVKESLVDSRTPIDLYVFDSVTGAIKQSHKLTLPDGAFLTQVRRYVTNPKNGSMQVITNTARDIGTNQSHAIVVSTITKAGQTTHEVYKNVDRVTLNVINQTTGVGQVDMGGRWPATVFSLPYPD